MNILLTTSGLYNDIPGSNYWLSLVTLLYFVISNSHPVLSHSTVNLILNISLDIVFSTLSIWIDLSLFHVILCSLSSFISLDSSLSVSLIIITALIDVPFIFLYYIFPSSSRVQFISNFVVITNLSIPFDFIFCELLFPLCLISTSSSLFTHAI